MEKEIISPEEKMKKVIFSEIDSRKYKVFLFWSRALNTQKNNSDYDIWIMGNTRLEYQTYLKLKRKLNELPYLVDLVDFNIVDEEFKSLALKKIIPWN